MTKIHVLGPFRLDAEAEIFFCGAERATLGRRAVALLRVLVERPGAPVSKDALIESAWSGLVVEEANLTVQVAALRRVLSGHPGGERWIETLPRRGYRYVGPVAAEEADTPVLHAEAAPVLALPDRPSIAVLPFQNMSGDAEQDYFADGMVDEIITGLSRIKWLFVIARNSTFTYKGRAVDVKQVGRALGVRYVLEGSVRKAAKRVRITVQMVEAGTGTHLWAERYDRPLDDIFALQDEITLSVVGAIEPNLREAEIERVRRKRPDSLDMYLRSSLARTPACLPCELRRGSQGHTVPRECAGARNPIRRCPWLPRLVPRDFVRARRLKRPEPRRGDQPCARCTQPRPRRRDGSRLWRVCHCNGRA